MGEDGAPTGGGPDDFTFPVPGPAPVPAPLTAKATVVDRSGGSAPRSGGAGPPGGARHASGGVRGGRAPAVPRPPLNGGGPLAGHSGRGEEEAKGGPARPAPGGVRPPNFKPGKVPLEKGYSQMDWMRLTARHRNLNGLNGQRPRADITMEEVRRHSTREDAWMVLRGKVYNVTPYMGFHPGGTKFLMMAAGKDGTALFNKYHRWVNADLMLKKTLVGRLAPAPPA